MAFAKHARTHERTHPLASCDAVREREREEVFGLYAMNIIYIFSRFSRKRERESECIYIRDDIGNYLHRE